MAHWYAEPQQIARVEVPTKVGWKPAPANRVAYVEHLSVIGVRPRLDLVLHVNFYASWPIGIRLAKAFVGADDRVDLLLVNETTATITPSDQGIELIMIRLPWAERKSQTIFDIP